jgi:hypothetical protein
MADAQRPGQYPDAEASTSERFDQVGGSDDVVRILN